jgi:quinol monooxygenase YgiN
MPVVIAHLQVTPGHEAEVEAALSELVDATHGEAGCQTYALHRDPDDPGAYTFVERWTSMVALENHRHQPHMAAFAEKAGALLAAPPDIRVVESVPLGDPMKGSL